MRNLSDEDKRIIDRAKRTLMQYLGFTEPQAHRYIEKHAMDMRVTRVEIARSVLKIYESRYVPARRTQNGKDRT